MNFTFMQTIKIALTSLCLIFLSTTSVVGMAVDSLGLKKENNKTYLVYKFGAKQSLFNVLKRFNLSVTEFKQVNPEIEIPVKTGELVFIPLHYLDESTSTLGTVSKTEEKPADAVESPKNNGLHIVTAKQSLLTVANLYKVTMAEIRKWNNLNSDLLKEGQRLIISAPTGKTNIDKSTLLPNKGGEESKSNPAAPEQAEANGMRKTIETGMAELIDVADNSGKYLALHKSVPIGTLVLVKNLANGQNIWVKVIGRLPNTDSKLIIKLSPKAFERLNAVDKRIRAEISYLVQ
jgi:LysM repeat protein